MRPFGVVIVNYNGRDYIEACLASVQRSTCRPAAVVVVDNASTDGSAELVARHFPDVVLIRHPENAGFTGGNNLGIRRCLAPGHEAIILLNPDTVVEADAFEALLSGAERHPRSLLGPRLLMLDDPTVVNTYGTGISWWRGRIGGQPHGRARKMALDDVRVGVLSGCCILATREALEEIGLFDEDYFLYFEDLDLSVRARRCGYELWIVPASRILHRESSATGGPTSPFALYYYARNRHHFVRKFQRCRWIYLAFLAFEVVDTAARSARALLSGRRDLAAAICQGVLDAWRHRTGRQR